MQIKAKVLEGQSKKKKSVKNQFWDIKNFNKDKEKFFLEKNQSNSFRLLSIKNIDINNIDEYMNPKIKNTLPDPDILDDMKKATDKLVEIIEKKIGILETMMLMDQHQQL